MSDEPLTPEEFARILWPGMFLPGWDTRRSEFDDDSWYRAHLYCLQKAEAMLQTIEVRRKSPLTPAKS